MPSVSFLDKNVAICGQLAAKDLPDLAAQGFRVLINNRPDREAWVGQPPHQKLEEAAVEAGIATHFLPFTLQTLQPEHAQRFHSLINEGDQLVLATCASGFRSALLWAIARIAFSGRVADDVMRAAAETGQPLDKHRAVIDRVVAELRR